MCGIIVQIGGMHDTGTQNTHSIKFESHAFSLVSLIWHLHWQNYRCVCWRQCALLPIVCDFSGLVNDWEYCLTLVSLLLEFSTLRSCESVYSELLNQTQIERQPKSLGFLNVQSVKKSTKSVFTIFFKINRKFEHSCFSFSYCYNGLQLICISLTSADFFPATKLLKCL